jgi:DNA invertase Pin-like site-specific DNA recombinase
MYKKSREKSDLILKLYNEGVILSRICEITSSSQLTVKKVLKFFTKVPQHT